MFHLWFYIPLRLGCNCLLLSNLYLTLHFNSGSIVNAQNSHGSALGDISKAQRAESLLEFMLFQ